MGGFFCCCCFLLFLYSSATTAARQMVISYSSSEGDPFPWKTTMASFDRSLFTDTQLSSGSCSVSMVSGLWWILAGRKGDHQGWKLPLQSSAAAYAAQTIYKKKKKTLGLYSLQLFTLNYFGSLQSFLVSRKTSDICFHLFLLVLNCKKPMIWNRSHKSMDVRGQLIMAVKTKGRQVFFGSKNKTNIITSTSRFII